MKRAKKMSYGKRTVRGLHVIIVILLLLLGIAGYYRAKVTERFGLKRFTSFTHPYCMEPLINIFEPLSQEELGEGWDVVVDKEIGVELHVPAELLISAIECRTHLCLRSRDYNGNAGQLVTLTRVDKRLGFPYEQYFYDILPTSIASYFLQQKNCSYGKVGEYHSIRQKDREKLNRYVYAIDADEAAYIISTENPSHDRNWDRSLTAIVANFRTIPIESKEIGNMGPYTGVYSPRIPYKNIVFDERDVYEDRQINGTFFSSKIQGITFIAYKGDLINMEMIVPGTINVMTEVNIEIYSYGPTVLKGEGRLEWRAPVTGRYFLVAKDTLREAQGRPYWLRTKISP